MPSFLSAPGVLLYTTLPWVLFFALQVLIAVLGGMKDRSLELAGRDRAKAVAAPRQAETTAAPTKKAALS